MRAVGAGLAYVAAVFALGTVLGVIRVLLLEPLIGPVGAVLVELPVILALAWLICGRLVGWFAVARRIWPRLGMGAVAFAVLIAAELALAAALAEGAPPALYAESAHRIGLAGQILFALLPALRLAWPRPRRGGA